MPLTVRPSTGIDEKTISAEEAVSVDVWVVLVVLPVLLVTEVCVYDLLVLVAVAVLTVFELVVAVVLVVVSEFVDNVLLVLDDEVCVRVTVMLVLEDDVIECVVLVPVIVLPDEDVAVSVDIVVSVPVPVGVVLDVNVAEVSVPLTEVLEAEVAVTDELVTVVWVLDEVDFVPVVELSVAELDAVVVVGVVRVSVEVLDVVLKVDAVIDVDVVEQTSHRQSIACKAGDGSNCSSAMKFSTTSAAPLNSESEWRDWSTNRCTVINVREAGSQPPLPFSGDPLQTTKTALFASARRLFTSSTTSVKRMSG